MISLCMLLFRNQMKLFVNNFMGLFCCFPLNNIFSAVVFITLKVILLRVAMLDMLNIMTREQAVLNCKNASQIIPKKLFNN